MNKNKKIKNKNLFFLGITQKCDICGQNGHQSIMLPRVFHSYNTTLSCMTQRGFDKGGEQVVGVVTRLRVENICCKEEEYACGGSVDILVAYYEDFLRLRIARTTKSHGHLQPLACGRGGTDKRGILMHFQNCVPIVFVGEISFWSRNKLGKKIKIKILVGHCTLDRNTANIGNRLPLIT